MFTEQQQNAYMKTWFTLTEEAAKNGFTWPSLLENDEWNQYMATGIYKMDHIVYKKILQATEEIRHIFQRMYHYITENKEGFSQLQLPLVFQEVTKTKLGSMFSYFTRLDLIVNGTDIKIIEINADTPTGYVEPSVANRVLCDHHGVKHPNNIESTLQMAWDQIIMDYNIDSDDTIYFTGYDWHEEDYQTVSFIQKYCRQPHAFIPIQHIIIADEGVYTPDGVKIDYLYRLYPLEYLPQDQDANGKYIGLQLLDHIAKKRVKIINPPSAFLMQNKGILALIWDLHEKKQWFTAEEHDMIASYFLPTYFSATPFLSTNMDYVSKAIYGREGGGVSIIQDGQEIEADHTPYYDNQQKIYQKYIEMPTYTIDTWDGPYEGKLLIGSHLIGGKPAGLFLRVGEKITGNLSMFVGLTVTDS